MFNQSVSCQKTARESVLPGNKRVRYGEGYTVYTLYLYNAEYSRELLVIDSGKRCGFW